MKNGISIFTAVAFFLPAFAMAAKQQAMPDPVIVVESANDFARTVKIFKEEIKNAGWSVLNANNMSGVLSSKGHTLHPVMIIDVCSGKYSAKILAKDEYRPVSAFMPCRVSIYQTSDGNVFLSRMNTGAFGSMMPEEVAEIMSKSDSEISKIITKASGK